VVVEVLGKEDKPPTSHEDSLGGWWWVATRERRWGPEKPPTSRLRLVGVGARVFLYT
jgi:hypothetical protein